MCKPATAHFTAHLLIYARSVPAKLGAVDAELDTLKETMTPVAKLYNWNLLLPKLRQRGLDVDNDMKVLIVAGDLDIIVDIPC